MKKENNETKVKKRQRKREKNGDRKKNKGMTARRKGTGKNMI